MSAPSPKILELLRTANTDAADRALVEAVGYVDSAVQLEIVRVLLERGNPSGLEALPGLFDQLEYPARARIVSHAASLFPALRNSIRSGVAQTRSNTLRIVRDSGNLRLSYLAAHALHDASPLVRGEAGGVLLKLAEDHCRSYEENVGALRDILEPDANVARATIGTINLQREERQFLVTALQEALHCFESHHRPEIVYASMLLVDDVEDAMFDHPSSRRGKMTQAMLDRFTETLSPQLVPFAYTALGHKDMRGRVIAAISACHDARFFAEMIRYSWMGCDPTIGTAMRTIRSLPWLTDETEGLFSLPEQALPRLPSWLLMLGIPPDDKVAILNRMFLIDDPVVHRESAWAMSKINSASSARALHELLDDESAEVRRIARCEIARRRRSLSRQAEPPGGRPAAWRSLLREARLSETFDSFWQSFERIDPSHGAVAGHHATSYIPAFNTQVRVQLMSRKIEDRLRAVRLIQTLGIAAPFRGDLYGQAQDPDPDIRAAAMMVLGSVADTTSRRILERGVNDDVPAVQATAILALDQMNADRRGALISPLCKSESAEVRAAAIRVMLRLRDHEAAANLIYMLHDPRPAHRMAALWVVQRLQLVTIRDRVAELAGGDPNPRVVRTACFVLRQFERIERRAHEEVHSEEA